MEISGPDGVVAVAVAGAARFYPLRYPHDGMDRLPDPKPSSATRQHACSPRASASTICHGGPAPTLHRPDLPRRAGSTDAAPGRISPRREPALDSIIPSAGANGQERRGLAPARATNKEAAGARSGGARGGGGGEGRGDVLLVGGEEEDGGEEHPPDEGDEPHR